MTLSTKNRQNIFTTPAEISLIISLVITGIAFGIGLFIMIVVGQPSVIWANVSPWLAPVGYTYVISFILLKFIARKVNKEVEKQHKPSEDAREAPGRMLLASYMPIYNVVVTVLYLLISSVTALIIGLGHIGEKVVELEKSKFF